MRGQQQILGIIVGAFSLFSFIIVADVLMDYLNAFNANVYQQGYQAAEAKYKGIIAKKDGEIQKLQGQIAVLESELNQWKQKYAELDNEYNRLITEKVTKYDVERILNEVNAVNYRVELLKLEVNSINNVVNQYDSIVMQMNVELQQTVRNYYFSLTVTGLSIAALSADAISIARNEQPPITGNAARALRWIWSKILGFISWVWNIIKRRGRKGGEKNE